MNEKTFHPGELAFEIDFEGRIEAVLRRHTALICWNIPGMSPVMTREDNGTCCFLQTEKLRCVATCAHVWAGYEDDRAKKGACTLWLSLVANDEAFAPSLAYEVHGATRIREDTGPGKEDTHLDLATFTFDGIDALEPWRFYRLRRTAREQAVKGEPAFFLGYPRDAVKEASANWMLAYTSFRLTVADVSYRQFVLHDEPGSRHSVARSGKETLPQRVTGASGSPVFRLANLSPGPMDLALAGVLTRVSSPGLTRSAETVSAGSVGEYELSDGDIYVTHSRFIHPDGSILE